MELHSFQASCVPTPLTQTLAPQPRQDPGAVPSRGTPLPALRVG